MLQINRLQGIEINDDGTKLFLIFHGAMDALIPDFRDITFNSIRLTTLSLNINAGIELEDEITNPHQ